ncbi:MAG TPA: M20/M25/M40 family metallo-hydrolase [Thermoanaerobaculia bacterium]|jgi:glutamate carboxypeptidase
MAGRALPEAVFARALAFLRELTGISSPSGDREGLLRAAQLLAEALAARGLIPEIAEESTGSRPATHLPVLVARGRDVSRGHLLLLGHLDTVLPALAPRIEGERLVATGAIDMKGGLAALVGALDLLAERGRRPADDLLLVAVPDEEVGGELSRRAVRRWGEGARALWVLEPGEPAEGGAETLVTGRRGMFTWHLAARGRSSHSGLAYWQGRSALNAAARWSTAAEALSARNGGPTISCARLVAGDAAFVESLASEADLLASDRRLNVVPDRAAVEGEARFLRPAEGEALARRLAGLAAETAAATGTEIDFHADPQIPPVDPDGPHRALAEHLIELAARQGWRLTLDRERGGISFPNFLPDPGRIPVLDGLGPVGGGMHTRDEYVDLESFRRRIVLLADLLQADAPPIHH